MQGSNLRHVPWGQTLERISLITSSRAIRSLAAIGAIGAITVGAAACGSSSSSSTASSTPEPASTAAAAKTTAATAAVTTVPVTLGTPTEFTLDLGTSTIPAGKVTFNVTNGGKMVHEFVVLKTTTPGADLKVTNSKADETGNIGETGDMAAGSTKTLTLNLKAGHYVVLCNLPGHYQGGMWKNVTVS